MIQHFKIQDNINFVQVLLNLLMMLILLYFLINGNEYIYYDNSYKFNEIIPLDKWKTNILTKIKSRIPDN